MLTLVMGQTKQNKKLWLKNWRMKLKYVSYENISHILGKYLKKYNKIFVIKKYLKFPPFLKSMKRVVDLDSSVLLL